MLKSLKSIFGSQSEREFKKVSDTIADINRLADQFQQLSDDELLAKTAEFRSAIADHTSSWSSDLREVETQLRGDLEPDERDRLNDRFDELERHLLEAEAQFLERIMPEAFALVKDACRRLVDDDAERAERATLVTSN